MTRNQPSRANAGAALLISTALCACGSGSATDPDASSAGAPGGGGTAATGASAVASGGSPSTGGSAPASGGQAPSAGGTGSVASLAGSAVKACETYCMTDADCCADLGLGSSCPSRYPDRVLCQIQPELGWDHVCRHIGQACIDDAECQAANPELICAENAPMWCSATLCPGLNTCLNRGCQVDAECGSGDICIVRGRVGLCAHLCATQGDCGPNEMCQERVYVEDPRAICVLQPNLQDPWTIPEPPPPECRADLDCQGSSNGPRCNSALGRCGCADDGDCAPSERCRCPIGQSCP